MKSWDLTGSPHITCLQVRIGRREPKAKELQRETKQATRSEKKSEKKKRVLRKIVLAPTYTRNLQRS